MTVYSAAILTLLLMMGCAAPKPVPQPASTTPPPEKAAPAPATAAPVPAPAPAPVAQPAKPPAAAIPEADDWLSLFDGKTLKGWAVTDFAGHGEVKVSDGKIILETGVMTGVTWTNDIPRMNYVAEMEAMRVDGSDFFCGFTFPVDKDPCSLIVGGWGGSLVGLSSLDGQDASSNETTKFKQFENGHWYKIRVLVKPTTIQAWIDDDKIVDANIKDRKISIRSEVELSVPFGIATYSTTGAIRNIRVRQL